MNFKRNKCLMDIINEKEEELRNIKIENLL